MKALSKSFQAALGKGVGLKWTPQWPGELKEHEAKTEAGNASKGQAKAFGHSTASVDRKGEELVNPISLCMTLEEQLPSDSILVVDGGDFVATM